MNYHFGGFDSILSRIFLFVVVIIILGLSLALSYTLSFPSFLSFSSLRSYCFGNNFFVAVVYVCCVCDQLTCLSMVFMLVCVCVRVFVFMFGFMFLFVFFCCWLLNELISSISTRVDTQIYRTHEHMHTHNTSANAISIYSSYFILFAILVIV